MSQYILRLDDASDYMDVEKWGKIEKILDKYEIKPLVGIIPDNQDSTLVSIYQRDVNFWKKVVCWEKKGWELALHGCYHKYTTEEGGVNPVNKRSEFAGVSIEKQRKMIRHGMSVLKNHGIIPKVFFAPSHTYDKNTLLALKTETKIRIISDTIANDIYFQDDFYYIPQQSGRVRKLPFRVVTFCYHPNGMSESEFNELDAFLAVNFQRFISISEIQLKKRRLSVFDKLLKKLYFVKRR